MVKVALSVIKYIISCREIIRYIKSGYFVIYRHLIARFWDCDTPKD